MTTTTDRHLNLQLRKARSGGPGFFFVPGMYPEAGQKGALPPLGPKGPIHPPEYFAQDEGQ